MSEKEEKSLGERQFKGYWKDWDEEIYDLNQKYAKGGRLSDLLRLMMYVFWNRPIPDELTEMAHETGIFEIARESPGPDLITEIQDLRAMMLSFDERLSALEMVERHEEEIKHLWREMGRMNDRLEQMRVNGTVEDDDLTTPLADPDAGRQSALSDKLKRMHGQFEKLQ